MYIKSLLNIVDEFMGESLEIEVRRFENSDKHAGKQTWMKKELYNGDIEFKRK